VRGAVDSQVITKAERMPSPTIPGLHAVSDEPGCASSTRKVRVSPGPMSVRHHGVLAGGAGGQSGPGSLGAGSAVGQPEDDEEPAAAVTWKSARMPSPVMPGLQAVT